MQARIRTVGWPMSLLLLLVGCAAGGPAVPAVAPAAVAGTSGAGTAPLPPTERLRVAWVSATSGYLPLHAARELGLFQKRGLEVELVFTSGPQSVQALLARELDVAYADGAAIVRAALAGGDTLMLGATST